MFKVYSKESCVQCTATYRHLTRMGIEFEAIDITKDADALGYVKEVLGYSQAPVVEVVDKETGKPVTHWGGFNPVAIERAAEELVAA